MRLELHWPASGTVSLLAALTTWISFLAWNGFSERPSGFLVPLLGACLLIAVAGMLLRSANLHPVAVAAVQVLVLLLWMNHMWAGALSLGGWLPTGTSLQQVVATLGHSMYVSQHFAAPVPRDVDGFYPAVVLAGAAAALLVDFLACGGRRVPLAGLPLLAVYTAPISILDNGVSWPKFTVSALCFLLLMATQEGHRLAHWGRQVPSGLVYDTQSTTVSGQAVRASARKIGLTATGLAVVVPLLVPTLGAGLLAKTGNGPGNGDGSVSVSNPMVSMKRDLVQGRDVNLVYVTTPDPDPEYLRIAVLNDFDGSAWRPGGRAIPVQQRAEGQLPPPPGLDPNVLSRRVPYTIQIAPVFTSRWLPTPYPISWIKATGDWRYDTTTMDFISAADGQTTAGMVYRLRALSPDYAPQRLNRAGPASIALTTKYTRLPKNMPDSVARLAEKVTANETTDYQKMVRLQSWFRVDGGFTYSLQHAPGDGLQELVRFLGTGPGSRTGYCQQFAASMAVMARSLGIPARVAVGFLQPQHLTGDTWVYSSHDMHAWTEVYFDGVGWVHFDPTPAPRVDTVPAYTTTVLGGAGRFHPQPTAPIRTPHNRFNPSTTPHGLSPNPIPGPQRTGGFSLAGPLAGLAVLLLAAAPSAVRELRRRRRWARARTWPQLAEAAWSELRDVAVDLRLGWDDSVTLRVRARDLALSFGSPDGEVAGRRRRGPQAAPDAARSLDRLVELVERARFARPGGAGETVDEAAAHRVVEDVAGVTRALRDGTGRARRLVARWWPMSLVSRGASTRTGRGLPGLGGVGVDHAT